MKSTSPSPFKFVLIMLTGLTVNVLLAQRNSSTEGSEKFNFTEIPVEEISLERPYSENSDLKGSSHEKIDMSEEKSENSVKYFEYLKEEEISPFVQINVKNNSGKNYINWIVGNDVKNGIFVVERSENGSDFLAIGFKKRIGSKVSRLSYYYQEESKSEGEVFYRLLAIGEDGTFKYSDVVKVQIRENFLLMIY